ncbi:MAG: MaoC family dehydratase [Solirubrobacteraceae bacterium]
MGRELGTSNWHVVGQTDVDSFAAVTGDYQWIHTDPERARASPFGTTVAHGYLTLSMAPLLLGEVISLEAFALALNYGLDKLRFPAPLPVGRSLRMRVLLDRVEEFPGGATLALTLIFERSGGSKPVCVANTL